MAKLLHFRRENLESAKNTGIFSWIRPVAYRRICNGFLALWLAVFFMAWDKVKYTEYSTVQYNGVQYSYNTVHFSAVQYHLSTVQCSTQWLHVQCSAIQFNAVQCRAVQRSAAQYSAVQCSTLQLYMYGTVKSRKWNTMTSWLQTYLKERLTKRWQCSPMYFLRERWNFNWISFFMLWAEVWRGRRKIKHTMNHRITVSGTVVSLYVHICLPLITPNCISSLSLLSSLLNTHSTV